MFHGAIRLRCIALAPEIRQFDRQVTQSDLSVRCEVAKDRLDIEERVYALQQADENLRRFDPHPDQPRMVRSIRKRGRDVGMAVLVRLDRQRFDQSAGCRGCVTESADWVCGGRSSVRPPWRTYSRPAPSPFYVAHGGTTLRSGLADRRFCHAPGCRGSKFEPKDRRHRDGWCRDGDDDRARDQREREIFPPTVARGERDNPDSPPQEWRLPRDDVAAGALALRR